MMSSENPELYEVTCLDCNTTKSYFTAQGVNYFKLNHEGHKVRVKEPAGAEAPQAEEPVTPPKILGTVEEPVAELPVAVPVAVAAEEPVEMDYDAPAGQVLAEDRVSLGNLVVDVVDDGSARAVKIFGIANGRERFTKSFEVFKINEVNGFLESGAYYDDSSKVTYTWTPEKIDLSMDVAKMIDEPPAAPEEAPAQVEPLVAEPEPGEVEEPEPAVVEAPEPEVPEVKVPEIVVPEVTAPPQEAPAPRPAAPVEEVLLGKRSYVQEGEEHARECARVSKVLKKFRWNTEPPYVIGAVFDDLVCVQSQTGKVESSLIEEVQKLGYTFAAIEAPAGIVSAWFKKSEAEPQEVAEFQQ